MTLNKAEKKINGAELDIFREKYVEKQNMVTLKEKWTYILLFVKESTSQEDNRIFFSLPGKTLSHWEMKILMFPQHRAVKAVQVTQFAASKERAVVRIGKNTK